MSTSKLSLWLQEGKEKAERATKGPWDFDSLIGDIRAVVGVSFDSEQTLMRSVAAVLPRDREWNGPFIAHARTAHPKALEIIGVMAEALEAIGCDSNPHSTHTQEPLCSRARAEQALAKAEAIIEEKWE